MRWLTFLTTAFTVAKIKELIDREKQLRIELTKAIKDNDEMKKQLLTMHQTEVTVMATRD